MVQCSIHKDGFGNLLIIGEYTNFNRTTFAHPDQSSQPLLIQPFLRDLLIFYNTTQYSIAITPLTEFII